MTPDFTTPEHTSEPVAAKPRRPFVLTGERLGKRVQLAEALLKSGRTITGTAQDLKISRHSVQAIAARMRTGALKGEAALSGSPADQTFDGYVKGDLQRVARLALTSMTEERAQKATLRDLAFTTDKTLARLEAIEARQSSLQGFGTVFNQFGLTPSHSASRITLEQKVTVETQHLPPATK